MAPIDLFNLYAKIALDTGDYESGLEDASEKTSSFADKLKSGLATAAKVGAAAITAVTTATAAFSAAVIKQTGEVASYGDNIDKMSQKMGLSAEAYQEWDAIMQHSGTSIESLQAGMKTLANAVESGNDAFSRLGITQEQIAEMNNEELFSATITALQNVENETERTYLAGQLLGRGATELGALLNTSAEDTEAMRQRVHELGGVMSDEAVKAAAAYQDSLQDMQTAFGGLSRNMVSNFLPSVTTVMDGLTELFSGNGTEGIALVSQGLNGFVENMSAAIPKVLETGTQILNSLTGAIIENLPVLVEAGTQTILSLMTGIVEQLPMIASSAVEIIGTLSNSISENLPEMIPTIVSVVLQIVDTLIDNVDMLVDASIEIIVALTEGLIDALPQLIEKAPVIIAKLVTAIVENVPKLAKAAFEAIKALATGMIDNLPEIGKAAGQIVATLISGIVDLWQKIKEVGGNIVAGIFDGISEKYEWLKGKVKGFFSGIVDGVKDFLGIHSPSALFRDEVGRYIALGVADGIDKNASEAVKAADDMAKAVYQTSKDWIDRQVKYENYGLREQLEVWRTIQSQFIKESQQYADAEEQILDIREKILQENIELEDEYAKQLSSRAKAIFDSYQLFNEVPEQQQVSGEKLLKNLQAQVDSIDDFYSKVSVLSEREGVGASLVTEIREMGPDAINELNALLSLSDEKLSEYAALYEEKQALANKIAVEELGELREETDAQIKANLNALEGIYEDEAPAVGEALPNGLAEGIMNGLSTVIDAAANVANSAINTAKDILGVHSPSTVFAEIGNNLALGLANGWEEEYERVRDAITNGLDFGTANVDFASSGLGISSAGIINSVSSGGLSDVGGTTTVNLVLPDGSKFATWQLPYLIKAAAANGTPIASGQYA